MYTSCNSRITLECKLFHHVIRQGDVSIKTSSYLWNHEKWVSDEELLLPLNWFPFLPIIIEVREGKCNFHYSNTWLTKASCQGEFDSFCALLLFFRRPSPRTIIQMRLRGANRKSQFNSDKRNYISRIDADTRWRRNKLCMCSLRNHWTTAPAPRTHLSLCTVITSMVTKLWSARLRGTQS